MTPHVSERGCVPFRCSSARMVRDPISLKSVKILRHGNPRGINSAAVSELRDQLRAADLRLTFGADKRMPAALALTCLWIVHVEDDRPTARTSFANMPSHLRPFHSRSRPIFQNSISNS